MPIKLSAQANSYKAFHQGIAQTQVGSKYTEGPWEMREDGTQQPRSPGQEMAGRQMTGDPLRPEDGNRRPNSDLADHSQKTLRP